MNWDAIGALAEVIGAVAVVVTLAYLAIQVRQNSAAIRSATRADIAKTQAELNWRMADNPRIGRNAYAFIQGEEMDELDKVSAAQFLTGALRTYENQYFAYLEGNFSASVWEGYRLNVVFTATQSNFGHYWDDRKHLFSEEFRQLVDDIRATD